jgi:methylmalonyl-CoA/ethylmalonyl-CoA epimerase
MAESLISHIGIAVADLDIAIERYRQLLGQEPRGISEVTNQKVRVAMFAPSGSENAGGRIELVAGSSPDSPVTKFVRKRGEGLHHICIYVDDLESTLGLLKVAGVRLIDEVPRIGAEGGKIAFVHPESCHGVLIELEERE